MSIQTLYYHFTETGGRVITDSRQVQGGEMFFALSGENFNGNNFAAQALENGAMYAVVDDPVLEGTDNRILVDDCLKALQELAKYHREQLEIPVLAITGSNGKTSTKELVNAVLSKKFKTLATSGNLNNHIGVPLTLLSITIDTEIAIIEMGANHLGEIKFLCQLAQPGFGMVTNVGKAHLEGFGSFEGVKKAKKELYDWLASNKGRAFVRAESAELLEMASEISSITTYGSIEKANCKARLQNSYPNLSLELITQGDTVDINTQIPGDYNFENILAAACVGLHFEVPAQDVKDALEQYVPTQNRSQKITHGSNTFIMDAYNANPSNMRVALEHFAGEEAAAKGVILGDMAELGEDSMVEHGNLLTQVGLMNLDIVILVGKNFEALKDQIPCEHFQSVEDLKPWFEKQEFKDMYFLVKGSRRERLEELMSEE